MHLSSRSPSLSSLVMFSLGTHTMVSPQNGVYRTAKISAGPSTAPM